MLILGIDVETTGTDDDRATAEIVELGCVLFDTDTRSVVSSYSTLLRTSKWGEEAAKFHKIPKHLSDIIPDIKIDPYNIVNAKYADFIVAHSAKHDHPLVTKRWPSFNKKPWLCTLEDLIHKDASLNGIPILDRKVTSTRLGHLCVDYNIKLNNWHRALCDAEACATIASYHDLKEAYKRKLETKYKLILVVGKFIKDKEPYNILKNCPSVEYDDIRYRYTSDNKKMYYKEYLNEKYLLLDIDYIRKNLTEEWELDGSVMEPKPY